MADSKLQRCSACKVIRYCSNACQRKDWPAHRDECKALKAMHQLHTYRSALRQQQQLDQRLASRHAQNQAAAAPFGVGSFQDNDQVVAAAAAAGHLQESDGEDEDAEGAKSYTGTTKDRIRLPSSMMRALARWIWARSRIGTGGKDKARGDGGDLLELCSHRERFAPEQLQQQAQLAIHLAQYLTAAARAAALFAPVSRGEANLDEMMQPETTFSQGDALRALGIDSATELLDLVCQFSCNSFTLTDSDLNSMGVCMHPSMAMINHACTPNSAVVFPFGGAAKGGQQKWNDGEDRIMQLVALRAIEPGEELLISYVDVADTYADRRKYLQKRYCFDCRCELCRQSHAKSSSANSQPFASPMSASSSSQHGFGARPPSSNSWIDPRRAVWCPQRCGGWIDGSSLEAQANAAAGVAKCNKCHAASNVTASGIAEDTQHAKDVLHQASQWLDRGQAEAAWNRCASVLPQLVERYPPSWQPLFQLLRLATTCLIEAGSSLLAQLPDASNTQAAVYCFDEAVRMQMLVVAGTQASNTPVYAKGHPARAIAIATLAKLVLAQFDNAQRMASHGFNGAAMQNSAAPTAAVCRAAMEQTSAQDGQTLSILRDPPSVPDEMRIDLAKQLLTQAIEELDIGFGRSNQGGRSGREMRTALTEMEEEMALLARTNSLSVS
uniref:SET domain-containing protein n=2 Tax=Kalmanozyma brasiliensis (strain GHG001) TaxID=1365824 RepID=V5EC22_KALBG